MDSPDLSVKRDTSERRQQISAMVRERGSVQVAGLAARFGVSVQTIRKDLHFLSERGVAERSYGGAISADAVTLAAEAPVELKRATNTAEKTRIGALAAQMVRPGDSIILDSGTTTLQIALALPDEEDITVLTNDHAILSVLARKRRVSVVMLGGVLRRKNMAFYGAKTLDALEGLHADKLFLGVDGLDVERGISTHYEPEAMLNRQMVACAREVVAVTDSSKLGRTCLHRIMHLDELDALVTDGEAQASMAAAAERFGFALHLA